MGNNMQTDSSVAASPHLPSPHSTHLKQHSKPDSKNPKQNGMWNMLLN